jgi:anaerobic magnesium-protoporphyrin IX monomethyl ester cyclase
MSGRRHRVVLYNPRSVFFTMPLALLAIGSHLDPARYEVVIVDGRLEPDPVSVLCRALDGALCLGVTALTGTPLKDAFSVSRAIRKRYPALPIVWGGWHPSMFGAECLSEPTVDITVQAQGEDTFTDICERLIAGQSMKGCLGCTWRDEAGRVQVNPARPLRRLDEFRPHNYDLIPVERYFELKGKRQLDYISSQGCQFRCAFCADPFVYERRWVGLSPERVGRELSEWWERYRFTDVNFQDETFFTRRERVEAIAGELLRRRIPTTWAATMRADQGARLPEAALARCRQSGLRRVLVGVESGTDEMLRRLKKDIKIAQVFEAAERIRSYSIAGLFPFIVGFPNESEPNVRASLDVARRLRAMSPDFHTPIFYFKPYPGTTITDEAVRQGYQLPSTLEEWSDFDFAGSVGGPWVSPERFRMIERFKFYQQVGYNRPTLATRWIRRLARFRCENLFFVAPVEMTIARRIWPAPSLS